MKRFDVIGNLARDQQADRRRAVQPEWTRRHAEPAEDLRLPARTGQSGRGLRAHDSREPRAPRVPPSGDAPTTSSRWFAFYRARPRRRRFRERHPAGDRGLARVAGIPVPRRAGSAGGRRRSRRSATSSSRRVSRSSCGAAFRTRSCSALAERGGLKDPAVLARQVRRMLDDPRADALVSNFAGQWLHLRNVETVKPDPDPAAVRRSAAPGVPHRNRALRLEHLPRGPQPARSAVGRLHVRQPAAGRALRHAARLRIAVPPRDGDGRESPRTAGPGQRPDRDLLSESHLGGAARQVDSREPARHAAAAAACRCAGAEGGSPTASC